MARSVWKGHLLKKAIKKSRKTKNESNKKPIKTWWKSTIIPDFIGLSFLIYNGKKFIPLTISEDMVGHKFGEFAPTLIFGHTPADKKQHHKKQMKIKNSLWLRKKILMKIWLDL